MMCLKIKITYYVKVQSIIQYDIVKRGGFGITLNNKLLTAQKSVVKIILKKADNSSIRSII